MKIGTGGFSVVADNEYKLFRIVVAEGEQVQFETAGFAGATLGIDRKLIHSVEPIKWTYKKANKWTELPLYLDKDGEKVSLHNEYGDLTLPSDYGIWDTETQVRAELLDVDGNLYFDEITLYRLSPKSGFRVVLNNTVAQLQKNKLGNFNLEDLKFSYKVYDNETLLSEGVADGQYEVKPSFDYGTVEIGGGRGGVVNLTSTLENEMEVRLGFSINKVGSETNTRKTAYFKVINHSLGHSWHVSSSSMLLEYDESGAKPVSIKVGLLDGTKYASRELYEVTYVNGDNIQGSLTEEADHYTYTLTEMNQDESQVTFYIKTINNDVAQKTVSLKRRAQSVPVLNFGFEPAPVTFTYRTNKSVVEDYVDVSTILEYGRKSLFDPEQEHLLEVCDVNLFVPEIYLNDVEIVQVDNNRLHQIKMRPTFSVTSDSVEIPVTLEGAVKIVGYPETTVKSTGRIQFLPSPVISDGLITNVDVMYGLSESTSTPPEEWFTEAPEWTEGMFMWTKTVKYFGDGNYTSTDPTCISGSSGQDGLGVLYIKEWYYWGTSSTSVPPNAVWLEAPGAWRPTEYLWTKTEIRYTDNSFIETAQICTTGAQGQTGANAKMVVLSGEQVFKYTNDFSALVGPSSIVLATSVQGVSSPSYKWQVKSGSSTTWTDLAGTGSTLTIKPTDSFWGPNRQAIIRCQVEAGVYDEMTVVKVSDGASGKDAYTIILTNETHSFAASATGNIPTAIKTTTKVIAMRGTEIVPATVGTATPAVGGLVVDTTKDPIEITASVGTSLPESGSINIPITVDGHSFTKVFSWTKTKQGAGGADAQYVVLSGEQLFKYASGATKPVPESITLSAGLVGLSGNGQWSYRKPGQSGQTNLGSLQGGTYVVNYNASEWSGVNSVTYRYTVGGKYDEITLANIHDGAESYTVLLTNENHSIACNELGSALSGELGQNGKAVSKIEVYKGSQKLVGGGTPPQAGQFYYTIGSSVDGVAAKMPNTNDTFYISSVTGDSGTIPITINIEGVQTVQKVMSFSKAKKGTDGADGNDGITMTLTNDSHTVPTDAGGNNGVYTGAKTKPVIYSSVSDVTSQWTISATASSGVVGSLNSTTKEYTVTNMTVDSGEVTFTATRAGFTTLTRVFTLSKNKQGVAGNDATIYEMGLTSLAINKKVDGTLSPSTVTVSSVKIVGNGTPAAYASRFRISETLDGSAFTVKYTSTANEASRVYTPSSANVKAIKFEHFMAGGATTKLDEQIVPVLSDGVNGTGVESVDVEYATSNDPKVEPEANAWSTNAPSWTSDSYIWSRTKTVFTGISTPVYSKPACITGNHGIGIANIEEQYAISSSSTVAPAENSSSWGTKVPVWETGKYIWTRSKITYSDSPTHIEYTTPYCDKSWEAIDGIVIGGTNIFKGTKDYTAGWVKPSGSAISGPESLYAGTRIIRIPKPTSGYVDFVSRGVLEPERDTQYTLSFWARSDAATTFNSYFYPSTVASGVNSSGASTTASDGSITHQIGTGWAHIWVTWKTNSTLSGQKDVIVSRMFSSASGWVEIAGVKFEKGNKATDWSPHPSDPISGEQIPDFVITADKIQAGAVVADKISAGAINADKITSGAITTDKLNAGAITADKIATKTITADKIAAGTITSTEIKADTITAGNIAAGTITSTEIKTGTIVAGNIATGAITADKITSNAVTTDKLNAGSVTAAKIAANTITAGNIAAATITAGQIAANTITSTQIKAGTITAGNISADAISSISISAKNLVANEIAAGTIKVTNANFVDASISGAKITSATITNAQIANATIESAKIKDLSASKLSAGTINTGSITMGSTDGVLTIAQNTIQIKDNQTTPKVRVQIGKDATNRYGIIVNNAAGKTIFDSDKGILIPDGLGSGVVSEDKIVDKAIGSTKLNVDELFVGNNAFINNLKAVEISADNIVTGTISNDRIDMKGLISFESLDQDLSNLFIPTPGSNTIINGGFIGTDTIKANSIDLYSGLTVRREDGTPSFAIAGNGEVEVNGLLRSGNYDDSIGAGYQISTDGTAVLNQAIVRGNVELPNAGMTNYGAAKGGLNILKNSDFSMAAPMNQTTSKNEDLYPVLWGGYNAGIANPTTSYHAHIDRETFGYNVVEFNESDGNKHWKGISYNQTLRQDVNKNSQYTLSMDVYSTIDNPRLYGGFYYTQTGGSSGGFHAGQFSNAETKAGKWTRIVANVPISTDMDTSKSVSFYIYGYNFSSNGIVYIKNVKLEEGPKATPWCPHLSEQLNFTRIWAGASYENRDSAPFRVLQDGTVYALNGYYSGVLDGELQTDNVHIHDDSIEINEVSGTHDAKVVKLTKSGSHINSDSFTMGNGKFQYLAGTNELNLNDANISLSSAGGLTSLKFDRASGALGGLNLIARASSGHHVLRHSTDVNRNGTLVIDSEGGQGTIGDFSFTRKNYTEEVLVDVHGSINVKTSIKSTAQPVEMRAVPGEGWGFYIV